MRERKTFFLTLFALALTTVLGIVCGAGCTLFDKGDLGDIPRNGSQRPDSTQSGDSGEVIPPKYDTVIYAAGIRFPIGYDWAIDTLVHDVPRELVLFRNNEEVFSVSVGAETSISESPDMNRIIDGHVYSDYSELDRTVISRDGKVLFKIPVKERINGFYVDGADVWTLGQRGGKYGGLCLRKNGAAVFSDDEGWSFDATTNPTSPYGTLWFKGGKPCFFYYTHEDGVLSSCRGCYMVVGEERTPIPLPENMTKVLDVKMIDGSITVAGQYTNNTRSVKIYKDATLRDFAFAGYERIKSCRLAPAPGGGFYITGICESASSGTSAGYICDNLGKTRFYPAPGRLVGLYTTDESTVIVYCSEGGGYPTLNINSMERSLEGNFRYLSAKSGYILGDMFFMAFASMDYTLSPFIYDGRSRRALDINGFIFETNVKVVPNS